MKPIQDHTDQDIALMTDRELAYFLAEARRIASNMMADVKYNDDLVTAGGKLRAALLLADRFRQAQAELHARGVKD